MKVAIDQLAFIPGQTGATAYWRKMLHLLPPIDPSIEYYMFVTPIHEQYYRRQSDQWPNLHFVSASYPAQSIPARLYYQEVQIPRFCDHNDVAIHLTCNPVPLVRRMRAIEIWKVLSLQYFFIPLQTKLPQAVYWRLASRIKAQRASVVLANSQDCSRILRDTVRIPSSKLMTVYEALDHDLFQPGTPDDEFIRSLSTDFGIRQPYILTISDNRPYKRQLELVRAFAQLCQKGAIPYHSLVIIGGDWLDYRNTLRQEARSLGVEDRVIFIDFLSIEILPDFYRAADLFVYPSVLETFGIPPLEAMACGIPTITSNRSAVLEVSGGGAWVVDPDNQDEFAHAMETLLTDQTRRHELVQRGIRWAQRYHWSRHAEQLVQIFHDSMAHRHNKHTLGV